MSRISGITRLSVLTLLGALVLAQAPAGANTITATPKTTTKSAALKLPLASKPAASSKHMMGKVDLNGASREELMKLPGIGEALADKIIAGRPFKSKADLVSKNVLTKKEYSAIASHVTAKQEAMAKTTSK